VVFQLFQKHKVIYPP